MPVVQAETYKALLQAGVSEELAGKVASEFAKFELRQPSTASQTTSMQSALSILQWMVWANLAINVVILIKLLG